MPNILSIDGGGIRGVIPAMMLAEIERRTGKPISESFDLIAGTSTGGLLALVATIADENGNPRYPAETIPDLYEKHCKQIFSRTRREALMSVDNWWLRRYPNTGISETLKNLFGDATIAETLTDVIITSYDIERRQPWFFRSSRAKQGEHCNFLIRDVARATTAAPTFFEPARIPNSQNPDLPFALIDGSMTSINPAMCAYVEARGMYPGDEDYIMVSLGTGNLTQPLPYEDVRRWGLLNWARPVADIIFDGTSRTIDYQLRQLLPTFEDGSSRYFRYQKHINGIDHRMDDVSSLSLSLIRQWGRELIEEHDAELDRMCHLLVSSKTTQPEAPKNKFFSLSSLAFWRHNSNGVNGKTTDKQVSPKAEKQPSHHLDAPHQTV